MTTEKRATPRYLMLGRILRPHGVRGELRMRVMTDYPERIAQLKHVFLGKDIDDAKAKPYAVKGARMHQKYALLRLEDIYDRNTADRLRDLFVMVRLEDAVPLEEDEFYVFELIGLRVETEDGYTLGTIKDIMETGANDVYVITSPDYGEVLFPAIEDTIIDHDIDNGVVRVVIPDGLLPEKKS